MIKSNIAKYQFLFPGERLHTFASHIQGVYKRETFRNQTKLCWNLNEQH